MCRFCPFPSKLCGVTLVKFGWRVAPNLVGQLPSAWRPFPAQKMALPRLRVDLAPLFQNGVGNTAVVLFWCDEGYDTRQGSGRTCSDLDAALSFDPDEIHSAYLLNDQDAPDKPMLNDVLRLVARLGILRLEERRRTWRQGHLAWHERGLRRSENNGKITIPSQWQELCITASFEGAYLSDRR